VPDATTTNPYALALKMVVETVSENTWCAGWYGEIEFHLWGATELLQEGYDNFYGRSTANVVLNLSNLAEGWWHWPEGVEGGPQFYSLSEWLPLYGEWKTPARMNWLRKRSAA
jgi:hypothetical protein